MGNTLAIDGMIDQLKWLDKDIPDYIDESPLKQSESADQICREHATNLEFLEHQFMDDECSYSEWNLCSLANIAYISLNAPEPYRSKAEEMRLGFIEWYRSNHPMTQ
jgi:hypothetical protein